VTGGPKLGNVWADFGSGTGAFTLTNLKRSTVGD